MIMIKHLQTQKKKSKTSRMVQWKILIFLLILAALLLMNKVKVLICLYVSLKMEKLRDIYPNKNQNNRFSLVLLVD